jgi:hypothetical protein
VLGREEGKKWVCGASPEVLDGTATQLGEGTEVALTGGWWWSGVVSARLGVTAVARRGSGPDEDMLRRLQSSLAEVVVVVDGRMAKLEVAEAWLDEVEAWRWRWLGLPAGWWQPSSAALATAAWRRPTQRRMEVMAVRLEHPVARWGGSDRWLGFG